MHLLAAIALACSLAHAAPVTVTGTIADQDGKPIPDVRVWLVEWPSSLWRDARPLSTSLTQADGSYVLKADDLPGPPPPLMTVVAHKEGWAIAWAAVLEAHEPIPLVLRKPTPLTFQVLSADGAPVQSRIGLAGFADEGRSSHIAVGSVRFSPELAERFSVQSTEEGYFELPWIGAESSALLSFPMGDDAEVLMRLPRGASQRKVTLPPMGTLRGEILASGYPGELGDLPVRVFAYEESGRTISVDSTTTDESGRFEATALAGRLQVVVPCSAQEQWQVTPLDNLSLGPGETLSAQLRFARAHRVTGRVLMVGSREPVSGVKLAVYAGPNVTDQTVQTDEEGAFAFYAMPGHAAAALKLPSHLVPVGRVARSRTVPDGDVALKDFLVARVTSLQGTVVDLQGSPVPDAEIIRLPEPGGPAIAGRTRFTADERGRFTVDRVGQGAKLRFIARSPRAVTPSVIEVEVDEGKPVSLTVDPEAAAFITGRVINSDTEEPVPGAQVAVQYYEKAGDAPYRSIGEVLTTDEDGDFRSPPLLAAFTYDAEASADSFSRRRMRQLKLRPQQDLDLGLIALMPATGLVAGTVLDDQGEPVANATVYNCADGPDPVQALSDEDGKFRLTGLYEGHVYLFADDGKRFGAVHCPTGSAKATLVITPEPEITRLEPPQTSDTQRDREEDEAVALELIDEAIHRYNVLEDPRRAGRFVAALARVDPERALAISDENRGRFDDVIYASAGASLLARSVDEALAHALETSDDDLSAAFLSSAVPVVARVAPDRLEEVLDFALPAIGCLQSLAAKAEKMAKVALAVWPVDPGLAQPIVEHVEGLADAMGDSDVENMARIRVAEALALVDADRAIDIAERLPDGYSRYAALRRIAVRAAPTDPDLAIELMDSLEPWERDQRLPHVVTALARTDLDRAVELADKASSDRTKALSLAGAAASLAPTDAPRACELFTRAVNMVCGHMPSPLADPFSANQYADALTQLACVGAQIGYPQPERLLLRALSSVQYYQPGLCQNSVLVMSAVVDTDQARYILAHALQEVAPRQIDYQSRLTEVEQVYTATAMVGAKFAAEMVRSLPEPDLKRTVGIKPDRYADTVEALLMTPQERLAAMLQYARVDFID